MVDISVRSLQQTIQKLTHLCSSTTNDSEGRHFPPFLFFLFNCCFQGFQEKNGYSRRQPFFPHFSLISHLFLQFLESCFIRLQYKQMKNKTSVTVKTSAMVETSIRSLQQTIQKLSRLYSSTTNNSEGRHFSLFFSFLFICRFQGFQGKMDIVEGRHFFLLFP